jgi:hypothetical protein
MLYLIYHPGWRVQVKLLDGAIRSQRKEAGTWAIQGQTPKIFGHGDDIMCDMFRPHIPRAGIARKGVS